MNIPGNFSELLARWMDREKLTQVTAAPRLGVTRPYLNQVLKGRKPGPKLVDTFRQEGGFGDVSSDVLTGNDSTADFWKQQFLRLPTKQLEEMAKRLMDNRNYESLEAAREIIEELKRRNAQIQSQSQSQSS